MTDCITELSDLTFAPSRILTDRFLHYLLVGSNDRQVIVWDLNGNLSLDCEIVKHQKTNGSSDYVHSEVHVSQNVDNMQLLEKIDDLADGSINSCCFHPNGLLVIGSGFVFYL